MKFKHIATGRGRRQERQKEAAERMEGYRALSPAERLTLVKGRLHRVGGTSTREVTRLETLLAAAQAPKKV